MLARCRRVRNLRLRQHSLLLCFLLHAEATVFLHHGLAEDQRLSGLLLQLLLERDGLTLSFQPRSQYILLPLKLQLQLGDPLFGSALLDFINELGLLLPHFFGVLELLGEAPVLLHGRLVFIQFGRLLLNLFHFRVLVEHLNLRGDYGFPGGVVPGDFLLLLGGLAFYTLLPLPRPPYVYISLVPVPLKKKTQ